MALLKFGSIVTEGSGKLGGHVIQHSKGGMQLRNKPIPRGEPSAAQYAIRSINPVLQAGWHALTDAQRGIWDQYAQDYGIMNAHGDHHPLSGHSLWMKYQFLALSNEIPFYSHPSQYPNLYLLESLAVFARMTGSPTAALKSLINKLISDYIACGYWALADVILKFNLFDAQAGTLNLKGNYCNPTATLSPVFTKYYGYQGNGSDRWFNTNFTRLRVGNLFTQNNAHFYRNIKSLDTQSPYTADGTGNGVQGVTISANDFINSNLYSRMNSQDIVLGNPIFQVGHHFFSRQNNSQHEHFINSTKTTLNVVSVAMTNEPFYYFSLYWGFLAYQNNHASYGYSLGAYLNDTIKLAVQVANNYFNTQILLLTF